MSNNDDLIYRLNEERLMIEHSVKVRQKKAWMMILCAILVGLLFAVVSEVADHYFDAALEGKPP